MKKISSLSEFNRPFILSIILTTSITFITSMVSAKDQDSSIFDISFKELMPAPVVTIEDKKNRFCLHPVRFMHLSRAIEIWLP